MTADGIVTPETWSALIIQVRAAMARRFAASKRNSSSVLATPVKGSWWMESSDRKRTARSEASNRLCRSKDAPLARAVTAHGRITVSPILGGLHHRYCRV
jgi:hypothetical protein